MKVGGQDIWQWSAPHTEHDERMKNATYYVADIEYAHWVNSFPMEWFITWVNKNVSIFYNKANGEWYILSSEPIKKIKL